MSQRIPCVQSNEDIENRLIQRTIYCKDKSRPYHQQVCVKSQEGKESDEQEVTENHFKGRVTCLRPSRRKKLVKLVGERCIFNCYLNDKKVKALWDTGTQVSLIHSKYVKENFPNTEIRPLNALLHVTAANGSEIPFTGFVELAFSSTPNQSDCSCVIIPFLVKAKAREFS